MKKSIYILLIFFTLIFLAEDIISNDYITL